jgi:uroporphyrinogen-III synthase
MTQRLPLIITRPIPGGEASLQRARHLHLDAYLIPLFEARALDWTVENDDQYDRLLLTSAQAPRLAGDGLNRFSHLPCFAVGDATAAAAREVGLNVVRVGNSDGQQLLDTMTSNEGTGKKRILWLSGRERTALNSGSAPMDVIACYAVDPIAPPPLWHQLVAAPAVLMAYSKRAAVHMAALTDGRRDQLTLLAISAAVAEAAGEGWGGCFTATQPDDTSMLALACALCHKQEK